MKKLLLILLTSLFILTACSDNPMSGYKISSNNHFTAPTFEENMTALEQNKQGIYYIGYTRCPWCQALVPYLENQLAENDATAYYIDTHGEDFDKARFTTWYDQLPKELQANYSVPMVVSISANGSYDAHTGTTPAHTDPSRELTDNEVTYLATRLDRIIKNGLK